MADRYFPNTMPDYVAEITKTTLAEGINDSLLQLLSLPYSTISEKFKEVALALKQTIVIETWGYIGRRIKGFTLYTGALGTSHLLFKPYQVTKNTNDFQLCSKIVEACEKASRGFGYVTFICGRAGVCALGAVVAKHARDEKLVDYYLTKFREIKLPKDVPKSYYMEELDIYGHAPS